MSSKTSRVAWWPLLAATLFASRSMAALPASGLPTYQELRAMFRAIDTSDNGAIDAKEWQAASERMFNLTDLNHDDLLDETELARNSRLRIAYPHLGSIRHGVITRTAFIATRDMLFRGGDMDHDDYVDLVEYEILLLARRAGWNDRNADERINMSELREILRGAIAAMDTDGNGWLSVEETPFLSPRHREEMDPEHNGKIFLEQLFNGYRWLLRADTSNKNRPRAFIGSADRRSRDIGHAQ